MFFVFHTRHLRDLKQHYEAGSDICNNTSKTLLPFPNFNYFENMKMNSCLKDLQTYYKMLYVRKIV